LWARTIPASLTEVVRLYSLRMWVEQSYQQVKHALGWAHYQGRSDLAIRRHWQLVCCAFSFCWWHHSQAAGRNAVLDRVHVGKPAEQPVPNEVVRKKKQRPITAATAGILAGGAQTGAGVAGAMEHALALLERVVARAPAAT
jgi:hypothetical protein